MNRKFFYTGSLEIWCALIAGCLFAGTSVYNLLTIKNGYIGWRGVYIPMWTHWILLPLGVGITVVSIYALIRDKSKPTYTDEEVTQAEAEMDALYFQKYGELPEKPKPEIVVGETVEPEKPQKNTE